ncbi:MAG: tRNA 2-thiocytidine(32) synthetase TtcA [Deltaproteobacteria bacterium]|nr:MAG: tRNA 2-thiocytidine(32) synthetase TtcA [Deltaproteobacteria bacterium]
MNRLLDKRVRRLVGKAICEYGLLEDGDRVLVGLSGGKDSLTLLKVLAEREKIVPISYSLVAVTVDLGFSPLPEAELGKFAESLGVEFIVKHTDIGPRSHRPGNPETPCFMCSRMRRKVLFETASELGCNKIALGHTKDDILVTFFMNVLYSGEISTMVPKQELFGGKLTIIRPLALLDEERVEAFARMHRLPIIGDLCPTKGKTKRAEVKKWLQLMFKRDRTLKGNAFHALSNVNLRYLLPRTDGVEKCP